jgi:predicted RNA-binding protein with PIN domain
VKQALEIALFVAARAEEYDPPVEPPRYLLPFTNFRKPVKRALTAAYRALEEDDEFRRRVAEDLDVEDVGRPSWLFLHRPDGWDAELEAIEVERDERRDQAKEAVEEQRAARRLREVEADVERLRAELAEAHAAAGREREQRNAATAIETSLRSELQRAQREADQASSRADAADLRSSEADAQLVELRAQLADARAELSRLSTVDVDLVRETLQGAADALSVAANAVDAALGSVPPQAAPPAKKPRRPSVPRRELVALPGGVRDDSVEAAEHLVRVPGAVMLIDGYNATHWAWESVPISEQRDRLLAAACELHARTGVDIHVVFDGDGHDISETSPSSLQPVRLTFTPAEVEADDVVIERVRNLPTTLPVIVASNDNRVRDACASAGANLLTIEQLMAVLRR